MTIDADTTIGERTTIYHSELVNLYGCTIGPDCTIGPFVEIQRGVSIGRRTKISSHTFICAGVFIGEKCFIGHNVTFTNDLYPFIDDTSGRILQTTVGHDCAIGSGATILPVNIGHGSLIGAGAVVTEDVPALSIVVGNPGRVVRTFRDYHERMLFLDERYDLLAHA